MTISLVQDTILVAASFLAGGVNSIAGGGTLLTFPALLSIGISPVVANATSTVALVPGSLSAYWSYRGQVESNQKHWLWLGVPSLVGGLVGAVAVVRAGDKILSELVPWLILTATVLFMLQEPVRRLAAKRQGDFDQEIAGPRLIGIMIYQLVVAVYGGFFGAGIGIMMLAALGFLGVGNINKMNGLKNFAAVCINGVAAATFIIERKVNWPIALLMMVGAIIGGYAGAAIAQKVSPKAVRVTVVAIGMLIAMYFFYKQLSPFLVMFDEIVEERTYETPKRCLRLKPVSSAVLSPRPSLPATHGTSGRHPAGCTILSSLVREQLGTARHPERGVRR